MDEFDDLKMTDSDDDEGAGERVRMIMEEIYKNQDKIKSEQDIEEMAERCTNMMTQMRTEAYLKKKDKKPSHRASGAGDKASPPPSRSSLKESPRRDSTKAAPSPRLPSAAKVSLKEQLESKRKPRPNFSELYKEKMEKLRVPGKMDLKGQTKTDSTKAEHTPQRPHLWGLMNKHPVRPKLNEAYYSELLADMKKKGVEVKGKEDETSLTRLMKTINDDEESVYESVSSRIGSSSESGSESDNSEIDVEEKKYVEKIMKELDKKEPELKVPQDISVLTKKYQHLWRATPDTRTVKTYGPKKRKEKNDESDLDLDDSSSAVETDDEDPFSKTEGGKEVMRKMKEMWTAKKSFIPSLETVDISRLGQKPPGWTQVSIDQETSKEWARSPWIGRKKDEVDIDSVRIRDIFSDSQQSESQRLLQKVKDDHRSIDETTRENQILNSKTMEGKPYQGLGVKDTVYNWKTKVIKREGTS